MEECVATQSATDVLLKFNGQDEAVANELLPLIYDELKRIAANYLRRERSDHTLQPTALVHEAYLKMIDITQVNWQQGPLSGRGGQSDAPDFGGLRPPTQCRKTRRRVSPAHAQRRN
jgi:hypothetical protein